MAPARSSALYTSKLITVCETFVSICGESTRQGLAAFFVRVAGCNLRCTWCDTTYAWEGGEERTVDSLLTEADETNLGLVVITGGEPLLQRSVNTLIAGLAGAGWTVLVETNGTQPLAEWDRRAHYIIDVKMPSAQASEPFLLDNLATLRKTDELKFVVIDRDDFDAAVAFVDEHHLDGRCPLLLSPVHGRLDPVVAAEWIVKENLPFRLQMQLHKILWGADVKGR